MHGTGLKMNSSGVLENPINKKVTFSYSEDEDEEEDDEANNDKEEENKEVGDKEEVSVGGDKQVDAKELASEGSSEVKQVTETETEKDEEKEEEKQKNVIEEPPKKKPCVEEATASAKVNGNAEKSIDKLIDAELKELGDKSKVCYYLCLNETLITMYVFISLWILLSILLFFILTETIHEVRSWLQRYCLHSNEKERR